MGTERLCRTPRGSFCARRAPRWTNLSPSEPAAISRSVGLTRPYLEGARSTDTRAPAMSKPRGVVEPSMVAVSVNEYVGDVSRAGYYEGHGVAHFRAGHRYEGGFSKGKMSGTGRYQWVDGIVYEGDFVDNVATGVGKYTWPDGATYEGDVRRGLRHGRGVQAFADGRVKYDGEWKDGMRHGIGRSHVRPRRLRAVHGRVARRPETRHGFHAVHVGQRVRGRVGVRPEERPRGHVMARFGRKVRRRLGRRETARVRHAHVGTHRRFRRCVLVQHQELVHRAVRGGDATRVRAVRVRQRERVRRVLVRG